jgi:hypothetical protein
MISDLSDCGLPTARSNVILERTIVTQPLKNSPTFHDTQNLVNYVLLMGQNEKTGFQIRIRAISCDSLILRPRIHTDCL